MRYHEIMTEAVETSEPEKGLAPFLKAAQQAARRKHCKLKLEFYGSSNVTIDWIERRGGKPGDGADALRAIVNAADVHGITLDLMPMGLRPKLVALYRDLGFKGGDIMKRSPITPP